MEKEFWLKRQRESVEMAEAATSSEARLIHLDLAGRYSIEAATVNVKANSASRATPSGHEPKETRS